MKCYEVRKLLQINEAVKWWNKRGSMLGNCQEEGLLYCILYILNTQQKKTLYFSEL